jgi:gas vesicle protein
MNNKPTRILLTVILVLLLANILVLILKPGSGKKTDQQIKRISERLDSAEIHIRSARITIDSLILRNESSLRTLEAMNHDVEQIRQNYEASRNQSARSIKKLKSEIDQNTGQLLKLREELKPLK